MHPAPLATAPTLLRRGPVIEVRRVELPDGGIAYEKRYTVLWPWIPLLGLLKANVPPLDARREARNAERLRALGVEAPRPIAVAAGWAVRKLAIARESTVVLAEVSGEPLDEVLRSRPLRGERRRIAAALGRAIAAMHRASIFHRDLYLCHVFWDRGAGRVAIIDVARAEPRRRFLERWRAKDLGALAYSARGLASRTDALAFLRAYFGAPALPSAARAVAARALAKAQSIAARGRKG